MIIDTHAHYDDEAYENDREEVLGALPSQDICAVVNMGASMEGARNSVALSAHYPHVYCGVGIHPDSVGVLDDTAMEELRTMCRADKCVCIGEIGLDYYWNVEPHEVQKEAFVKQILLAQEEGLPINVHSRDAAQDTFDIIRDNHRNSTGGIIHAFSGSVELAREYVKMGFFLGVGGVVTFKNGKTLKKVVEDTPIEYLVTETDCPYLTPEPFRGKRNTSANIRYIVDMIAQIKGIPIPECEQILIKNACRAYPRLGKALNI